MVRINTEILTRIATIPGVRSATQFIGCGMKNGVVTTDRTVEGGKAGYVPHLVDGPNYCDGADRA